MTATGARGDGPPTVVVQLRETVEMDGRALETPECLTFDFDGDGRIERIAVYVQTHPPAPDRGS